MPRLWLPRRTLGAFEELPRFHGIAYTKTYAGTAYAAVTWVRPLDRLVRWLRFRLQK